LAHKRAYERSHPWLTFSLDTRQMPATTWLLLGETRSKCEHLAGVPLRPETARHLNTVYLAKGARATTAIEGNTLSEEQVLQKIEGKLELPPSKEYLGKEIENIVSAFNQIKGDIISGGSIDLTVERICAFNAAVLKDLPRAPEVVPGQIRSHSVGVMGYRGAPAEDCRYLLERLTEWLRHESFQPDAEYGTARPILAAILAHLYLAWIHPFGDGNGRTARLVEFAILISAGVPIPAAHLLSNHYNETRSEYYRQLDMASRSGGDVIPFIRYALQGFVDGLRAQLQVVRGQQLDVAWRNYVHELFRSRGGGASVARRRRELVLELSTRESVPFGEIATLTPHMALLYGPGKIKTLRRDLNEVERMGLVEPTVRGRWRARTEVIAAFLPARRLVQT
jgi:Fic family protein